MKGVWGFCGACLFSAALAVTAQANEGAEQAAKTAKAIYDQLEQGEIPAELEGLIKPSDFKLEAETEKSAAKYQLDADILKEVSKNKKQLANTQGRALETMPENIADVAKDVAAATADGDLSDVLVKPQEPPSATPLLPQGEYAERVEPKVLIFASTSMGEAAIKDMFSVMKANFDKTPSVVLLRGLIPGTRSIHQVVWHFRDLAKDAGIKEPPSIYLDPEAFTDYQVERVPTMVYRDHWSGLEVARISGTTNIPYLAEKVDRGTQGDLGSVGDTYEIAEISLIEELKARSENIDWEAKKKKATENFWASRLQFLTFPIAQVNNRRLVDPTIQLEEDMRLPDGRLIAKKGTRYNPLSMAPFNREIYVFDGTDDRQLEKVKSLAANSQTDKIKIYVTTSADREAGFKGMEHLEAQLQGVVYILQPELAHSLKLKNIPSVVTDYGELLEIKEYALKGAM